MGARLPLLPWPCSDRAGDGLWDRVVTIGAVDGLTRPGWFVRGLLELGLLLLRGMERGCDCTHARRFACTCTSSDVVMLW